jgi:hypothetical protein
MKWQDAISCHYLMTGYVSAVIVKSCPYLR